MMRLSKIQSLEPARLVRSAVALLMIAALALAPTTMAAAPSAGASAHTAATGKPHHGAKHKAKKHKAKKHKAKKHKAKKRKAKRTYASRPRRTTPGHSPTVQRPAAVRGPDEQGFVAGDTGTQDDGDLGEAQFGGGDYDNGRIADIALSKLGHNLYTPGALDHGQCKQAVNDWVNEASGGTQRLGGDYHSNYAARGGALVARDSAVKGDIIQLYNPRDERSYYRGMHTAVVVSHAAGSDTFDVVDSNWQLDRIVRRHAWNPYASAAKYGLAIAIWRMGSAPAAVSPPTTPAPAPAGRVITVDNRVTNGGGMREDSSPARLTTQPWVFCGRRGCNIGGTERSSGGTYASAVCQTSGERTTNGNDGSAVDDGNPELFSSTRYYGVRLDNGTFGFVSEVWIRASDRGGLGLPGC